MRREQWLRPLSAWRGFSLVEMLVVLALIAILITLGSQVSTSVLRSTELSTEAAELADELSRASLESIKRNQPVQFRFYRFVDEFASDQPLVRGYQILNLDSETGSYRELERIRFLKSGIAIHESTEASTILTLPERSPVTRPESSDLSDSLDRVSDPELPAITPYTYYQFEFRPDGSTNLPKDQAWGLVITYHKDGVIGEVSRDFRALGINPFTGTVERY